MNLAAHVSPAFRVDLGDVVTVGAYSFSHTFVKRTAGIDRSPPIRAVPAVIKNRAIQRVEGLEEQGLDQNLRQVLTIAVPYYVPHASILFCYDERANRNYSWCFMCDRPHV